MNNQNKFGVCQIDLNLSRRQIQAIAEELRRIKSNRYFVPDEEVHAVVHKIHSTTEDRCKIKP